MSQPATSAAPLPELQPAPAAAPPAPAKIFFGWYMLGAAVVIQSMATFFASRMDSVLLGTSFRADLNLSLQQYGIIGAVSVTCMGIFSAVGGTLLDRYGSRTLLVVGGLALAGAWGAIALTNSWIGFIVLRGLLVGVGFGLTSALIVFVALSKWFVRGHARVVGIVSATSAIGMGLLPVVYAAAIERYGWRLATMGAAASALLIVAGAMVMRRAPEDYGLLPDGLPRPAASPTAGSKPPVAGMTRAQAVRTAAMWTTTVAFGLHIAVRICFMIYVVAFLTSERYTLGQAAVVTSWLGWGMLVSRPAWAWLMIRVRPRPLMMGSFVASGLVLGGMVLAVPGGTSPWLIALVFVFGGIGGGQGGLFEFDFALQFGRKHLGAIRGVAELVCMALNVSGQVAAALWFGAGGNYRPVFLAASVLYVAAGLLLAVPSAPKPSLVKAVAQ